MMTTILLALPHHRRKQLGRGACLVDTNSSGPQCQPTVLYRRRARSAAAGTLWQLLAGSFMLSQQRQSVVAVRGCICMQAPPFSPTEVHRGMRKAAPRACLLPPPRPWWRPASLRKR